MEIIKYTANLDEILKDKKPHIVFYAADGAMGIGGLSFVLYDDTCVYLNHRYSNSELWDAFEDFKKNAVTSMNEFEQIYLGCGNECLIAINDFNELMKYKTKHKYIFGAFRDYLETKYNLKLINLEN